MENFIRYFERYVVIGLLGMMVVVVFLGTVELGFILVEQMLKPPRFILLDINEMLRIFGFFMMILIGLELIESIKVYLVEEVVHVEVILLVAIIADSTEGDRIGCQNVSAINLSRRGSDHIGTFSGVFGSKKGLGPQKEGAR